MKFRNVLLAGTAATAITVGASTMSFARDSNVTPPTVRPNAINWSGFYGGLHIGYGQTRTKGCFDCGSFLLQQQDLNLRGVLGGLQFGYNWQRGNLVFGWEGDLSFMRWKDKKWDTPSTGTSNTAAKVDMLASVRARLGVALNQGLWYGTAGIAIPKVRSSVLNSGDSRTFKFSNIGGVIGAGYEWAATKNIRYRAEGLYYFFNQSKTDSTFHSFSPGEGYKLKNSFVFRVGATYYFNP